MLFCRYNQGLYQKELNNWHHSLHFFILTTREIIPTNLSHLRCLPCLKVGFSLSFAAINSSMKILNQ